MIAPVRQAIEARRQEEERLSGNIVYALVDPRTDLPRYVGSTMNAVSRLSSHRSGTGNRAKDAWIAELKGLGLEPHLRVLEKVIDSDDLDAAEKRWAIRLRKEGAVLFNGQIGGRAKKKRAKIILGPGESIEVGFKGHDRTVSVSLDDDGEVQFA